MTVSEALIAQRQTGNQVTTIYEQFLSGLHFANNTSPSTRRAVTRDKVCKKTRR